ncbi:hypothetical protein MYSTI_01629 [Myxococcus stipitatus DSM 14675]|uniref:Lipoprotein n=1 Tax=Myxococcus stipitatus (strain DSM 14675 / JCM 12634 / Mx s8) TaxID=1278073 RepID=L7U2H6_MYXSD|nr:hypothetical protein [Myxococcus stipitatus]AGC42961.1 hypothetical protein MYSTI_01629 [Myxococcus stipitatus DSM 14675]
MPRAPIRLLSPLLALLMGGLGAPALAGEEPSSLAPTPRALEELERQILGGGCAPRLLGDSRRRFVESQLLCDAHLSFILVQLALDGAPLPESPRRLKALLADALTRGRGPFLKGPTTRVRGHTLPDSVLYKGYVLLMLAGMERAGMADAESTALFDALATSLESALSRQLLLPSFTRSIWPCDSAPAAAGLLLHGRLRGNALSQAMGERLTAKLAELAALPTGFPTRVNAKGHPVEATPRATTLAWTGAFLSLGAHPTAATFTTTLVKGYCDRPGGDLLPFAACREWPRGVDGPEDSASGPLMQGGYSVGASTLALAATHLSNDYQSWHRDLVNSAREMGIRPLLEKPHRHPLEAALYWWGTTARPW